VTGEVFWVGETKWGPRIGIDTGGGNKIWARPTDVALTSTDVLPAPAVPPVGGLMALAAALDGTAAAPAFTLTLPDGIPAAAVPAMVATVSDSAVAALTARVTGLELLVASLMAKVAALESAAPGEEYMATARGPVSDRSMGTAADYGSRGDVVALSVDPGTHCHDGHDGLFEEAS